MKRSKIAGLLLAGMAALTTQAAFSGPNEVAIETRQGYMKMVKFNAGPLFGMAKGKMDYNAALATELAGNLLQLSEMKTGRMWREGSSDDDYAETDALIEIWAQSEKFLTREQAFKEAVATLEPVASQGVEALRGKVRDLGKSCKGCHDTFRAE